CSLAAVPVMSVVLRHSPYLARRCRPPARNGQRPITLYRHATLRGGPPLLCLLASTGGVSHPKIARGYVSHVGGRGGQRRGWWNGLGRSFRSGCRRLGRTSCRSVERTTCSDF